METSAISFFVQTQIARGVLRNEEHIKLTRLTEKQYKNACEYAAKRFTAKKGQDYRDIAVALVLEYLKK